jgi:molybdopterin-guanine dinucleotide biosynthesis protein A
VPARTTPPIEAFILAGGRSSRFGSDKALAVWHGKTLLEHVLRAVVPLRIPTRVVTRDPEPYLPWATAFVLAEHPGLGPVEAVRASLESSLAPWGLFLTVDMPSIGPLLRPLMLAANSVEQDVNSLCYADGEGRAQPFPALYRRDLVSRIADLGPGASMHALQEVAAPRVLGPRNVPGIPDWNEALHNVNEPRDLA